MSFLRTFSTQPSLLEVVSKLRNQTSLSLAMCRKAAIESNYDFQSALNLLLKSSATSLNSNFKATSRGKDGIIGIMGYLNRKCLIELRCDSDFVSLNSEFEEFAQAILNSAVMSSLKNISNYDKFILPHPFNTSLTHSLECIRSKFRENISIESIKIFESTHNLEANNVLGHYLHQRSGNCLGKIGAIVDISFKNSKNYDSLHDFSNLMARQLVALNDPKVTISELLESTYLFGPIGKVSEFIKSKEADLNDQIVIENFAYAKAK